MPKIDDYLKIILEKGASDLHIVSTLPPSMRLEGKLVYQELPSISDEEVKNMVFEILNSENQEKLLKEKNIDFAYEIASEHEIPQRFRCNIYNQKNGYNIIMRVISDEIPTLESLSLPSKLKRLTEYHQGLVCATGTAGCGKTSTLAALIEIINQSKPVHIITVEDPIEYIFANKKALINQRQIGKHVESYHTALKGALREDPDVIYIAELRDLETTQMAITAAETGHLVFTTLHTNNAPKTVDRLIDSFPVDQQSQIRTMLSESLKGVVSQQLIPRADGNGRVAAAEILIGTLSVANMIREGKTFQLPSAIQIGKNEGMCLMDYSILDLYEKKLITKEEAQARIVDHSLIKD
ncbi:MAG: PilT/PilU family type 4a pilus ATPase [Armatimonadetes bacterium]|nr:PilT/PilU family type 4a pilus ATPase [Armatimonadota bacterium]